MNANSESEPLIGDDGELLWDDTSAEVVFYLRTLEPPESHFIVFWTRVSKFVLVLAGLLVSVTLCSWNRFLPASPSQVSTSKMPIAAGSSSPTEISEATLNLAQTVRDVRWSPRGRDLGILTDYAVLIWDMHHYQTVPKNVAPQAFDWSPNPHLLFVANAAGLSRYDAATMLPVAPISELGLDEPIWKLEWSSSHKTITAIYGDQRTLAIFSVSENQRLYPQINVASVDDLDWFSDEDRLLLVINSEVFQWQDGKISPYPVKYVEHEWTQAAISSHGEVALVGKRRLGGEPDTLLVLYAGVPSWSQPLPQAGISAHHESHTKVKWAANDDYIATFREGDKLVVVWNSQTGERLDTFEQPTGAGITSIDWSPDSRYLAISSTSQVIIWKPGKK